MRQRFLLLYPAFAVLALGAHLSVAQHATSSFAFLITAILLAPLAVLAARFRSPIVAAATAATSQLIAHYLLGLFAHVSLLSVLGGYGAVHHEHGNVHGLGEQLQILNTGSATPTTSFAVESATHNAVSGTFIMLVVHVLSAILIALTLGKVDCFLDALRRAVRALFRPTTPVLLVQTRATVAPQKPLPIRSARAWSRSAPRRGPPVPVFA